MKKLLLSLAVVFAAQGAMASVLELSSTPLNPVAGARSKHVKLYSSGDVHVTYCEVTTGHCDPSAHLATLSVYAMNHIYSLLNEARYGAIVDYESECAAVPTETKTYNADSGTILLETGTYPCGAYKQNSSDAAYYLLSILRQYE